jgi:hypothetical protein
MREPAPALFRPGLMEPQTPPNAAQGFDVPAGSRHVVRLVCEYLYPGIGPEVRKTFQRNGQHGCIADVPEDIVAWLYQDTHDRELKRLRALMIWR